MRNRDKREARTFASALSPVVGAKCEENLWVNCVVYRQKYGATELLVWCLSNVKNNRIQLVAMKSVC